MRLILGLIAAASLGGCVAYGGGVAYENGYYDGGYYSGSYYAPGYYGHGRHWRDRDRDGVPNWRDARPDNPYRR